MKLEGELKERIESLLGGHGSDARLVEGGYTPAARWLVRRNSGETAFAKVGTTPGTAGALRKEAAVYRQLEADFMPRTLGWQDHPEAPLLLLEDLSACRWPPPPVRAACPRSLRSRGTRPAVCRSVNPRG